MPTTAALNEETDILVRDLFHRCGWLGKNGFSAKAVTYVRDVGYIISVLERRKGEWSGVNDSPSRGDLKARLEGLLQLYPEGEEERKFIEASIDLIKV